MPFAVLSSSCLTEFRVSSICCPLRLVCSPTWSTLAWMGAVVFRTYFLVAHPPASKAPIRRQLVARKAFMFKNLDRLICNRQTNVADGQKPARKRRDINQL